MEQMIRNNIVGIAGEEAAKKADIVAARATIIAGHDAGIDLSSLIVGLWVGTDGEMPETLQYGVLGLVEALTNAKMAAYETPMPK